MGKASEEAGRLVALCAEDRVQALAIVERQLNTVYTRAQVLVSLAGAVVTVTGFSGRVIAGTNTAAQLLLVGGLGLVVASAVFVLVRVMGVRWITADLVDGPEAAVERAIERRDRKTLAYLWGGLILALGLALYAAAVSIMLLAPGGPSLPAR